MKLPNGYGSVRKLSGKRRNPWHVQKTVDYSVDLETKKVKQQRITLGFYPTQKDALQALADYNSNPYDIKVAKITFEELYEKWKKEKFESISASSARSYDSSFQLCEKIHKMRFVDIKLSHLQSVIDQSGKNKPQLKFVKTLFNQLFKYAIMHEIIDQNKNMVSYLNIEKGNPNARKRVAFTKDEIDLLWSKSSDEYVKAILMLIYSGVRISEMLNLKKENVHLDKDYFEVIKSKTESGIRIVPIAAKTKPFFEYWYNKNDCEYLLSSNAGDRLLYKRYLPVYFNQYMDDFNMKHRPHDTRHTCISLLAEQHVEQTIIKKIVGHAGAETLTERVYTHLDFKVLLDAINKI